MTTEKQTPEELAAEIRQFIADEFGITGGTLHSKIKQLAALANAQAQQEPVPAELRAIFDGLEFDAGAGRISAMTLYTRMRDLCLAYAAPPVQQAEYETVPWPVVTRYSGGASPEGVAGRVWVRLNDDGPDIEYVPQPAQPDPCPDIKGYVSGGGLDHVMSKVRAGVVPDGWRPDFPAVMTEDYIAGLGDALEIVGDEQRYPNQEGAEHNNPPLHRCMARIEKVQEEARAALNAAPPAPAAENPTTSDSPEYTAGWKAGYKHGAWGGVQQPAERKPLTRQQLREAFHRHTGCTLGNDIGLAEHVCTVVERTNGIGIPPADAKEGE